jgi:hypothetical protein
MEKIDRELLIKEISSRLPYGIKAQVLGWDEEKGEVEVPLKVYSINTDGYISLEYNHYDVESVYIEDCLLYLRPMSSMTEEERKEYEGFIIHRDHIYAQGQEWDIDCFSFDGVPRLINWLNAHHFDYRGLIPKGLAIAVTEDNNPYKS